MKNAILFAEKKDRAKVLYMTMTSMQIAISLKQQAVTWS